MLLGCDFCETCTFILFFSWSFLFLPAFPSVTRLLFHSYFVSLLLYHVLVNIFPFCFSIIFACLYGFLGVPFDIMLILCVFLLKEEEVRGRKIHICLLGWQ